MKTQRQIYDELYHKQHKFLSFHSMTLRIPLEKINNISHRFAIIYTWKVFNQQKL